MTKLEIINLALLRIGESPIQSLDEGSTAANSAKLLYEESRRAILRDSDWNFAIKQTALACVESDEKPMAFAVPSDCLRVMKIFDKSRGIPNYTARGEWFREQGGKLFTYAEVPVAMYVRDEDNVDLFDAKFTEALTYKLAGELAMPVKQSTELMAAMLNAYQNTLATACTETQNERGDVQSHNPYVEVRNAQA